jgi:hypothetical protein
MQRFLRAYRTRTTACHSRYNERSTSDPMPRFLITLGVVLVVAGLAWPLLAKLGLGRLPGDIHIEREGFSFYLPITTGLLISVVVSLILWLLRK